MSRKSVLASLLFSEIEHDVEKADIAILNQETILGGTEYGLSSYPCFNSPQEVGDAEVDAGFDVVLCATNHALDIGAKGIYSELNYWRTNHPEIGCLGIHDSYENQNQIYVKEVNGIKIAILNYTFGTNGIKMPSSEQYLVDYLEEERIRNDVASAKELADFVMVSPHWGIEYHHEIDGSQVDWTNLFLECGVDLVIGTHPHCIQPIEVLEREDGHKMLVYYSLGNYVNGTNEDGDKIIQRVVGGMAKVTVRKYEDGTVGISYYTVVPLICHFGVKEEYKVYKLEDYTDELAQANLIKLQAPSFSRQACVDIIKQVWPATE